MNGLKGFMPPDRQIGPYAGGHLLSEKGVFSEDDQDIFRRMVGFRNVVGHDYMNIDKKMVYSILTEGTQDIKGLVSKIVKRFL